MEASPSNALKIISLLDSVREPEADKMLTPHTPASYVGAASCCKLEDSAGDEFSDSAVALKMQLEDLEYLKVGVLVILFNAKRKTTILLCRWMITQFRRRL
jgi:hypothetical protein